ncbi:MAG: M48 family metallopeptidase [Balneolaceae bacterium]|nr:M48 family metallopeptidase [Balneolaceae bacterium]
MTRKNVKNLNLRVYPSDGRVTISCPRMLSYKKILRFTEERIPWIKKHLQRPKPKSSAKLDYVTGEMVPVWGDSLELSVSEANKPRKVLAENTNGMHLRVKTGDDREKREKLLESWYRAELKREIPLLISEWEPRMEVSVREFGVKKMKTRWGTCNIRDRRIWINLELAKKHPDCLEFIVVHEMVHLLERLHSKRFYRLMDQFLPDWREREKMLTS